MQVARKIFEIQSSLQGNRPEIDYEKNSKIDWLLVSECLDRTKPASEYLSINISIDNSEALEWDYYRCSGTFGLFSERAVDLLGNNAFQDFELVPAAVNSQRYFFLKCLKKTDCLDRDASVYVPFDDPIRLMTIQKYVFKLQKIRAERIFCIPEYKAIYCSQVIEHTISKPLKGFKLVEIFSKETRT
jgi:hypothetical protein